MFTTHIYCVYIFNTLYIYHCCTYLYYNVLCASRLYQNICVQQCLIYPVVYTVENFHNSEVIALSYRKRNGTAKIRFLHCQVSCMHFRYFTTHKDTLKYISIQSGYYFFFKCGQSYIRV